jgi:hypothetical protein
MPAIEHLSIAPQRPQMGDSGPAALEVRFADREWLKVVVNGPSLRGRKS